MCDSILDRLARMPRLVRLLDEQCDFRQLREAPPDWFALQPDGPIEVFGRDASGGRFLRTQNGSGISVVLYVSSEGEAGAIALDVEEALSMMTALPYWRDCLKFSAGGSLEAMRRAEARFELELRSRQPKIDRLRQDIRVGLRLPKLERPLERLHERVSQGFGRSIVAASDRTPFASLFNTFAI